MHEGPTPSQVLGARCTWREFLPNAGVNTSVETVKIPKSCWESLIKNAIHRGRGRSPLHAALGRPGRRGCRGRSPLPPSQKVPPGGPAVPARSGEAAPGGSFSLLGSLARSPARCSLFFVLLKRTLRAPGGAPWSHWLPPIICQSRHFGGSAALIVAQTRFQVS